MSGEKLVRDLIPDIAPEHTYRIATKEEMPGLLLEKLREEAGELLATTPGSPEEIEEAADVLEVCMTIFATFGPSTAITMAMADKAYSRGQFQDRIVMRTDEEES